jgi:hypothetical protein
MWLKSAPGDVCKDLHAARDTAMFCVHVVPLLGYDAMKTSPCSGARVAHFRNVSSDVMGNTGKFSMVSSAQENDLLPVATIL